MSIDFSKVTAITTPSGSLSNIKRTSDLVQLWPTVSGNVVVDASRFTNVRFAYGEKLMCTYYSNSSTDTNALKNSFDGKTSVKCKSSNLKVEIPIYSSHPTGSFSTECYATISNSGDSSGGMGMFNFHTFNYTITADQTSLIFEFPEFTTTCYLVSGRWCPSIQLDFSDTLQNEVNWNKAVWSGDITYSND